MLDFSDWLDIDDPTPKPSTDPAELVSVGAAARALGLDRRTLSTLLQRDAVPTVLERGAWRVSWIELAEWIQRNNDKITRSQL